MQLLEAVKEADAALRDAALERKQEVTISAEALWLLMHALRQGSKRPSFLQRWLHNN
jgi:hypothetical protein